MALEKGIFVSAALEAAQRGPPRKTESCGAAPFSLGKTDCFIIVYLQYHPLRAQAKGICARCA